jgi:hypothetical protein
MFSYNHWDFVLIAVVILQATIIAYIYRPVIKAFVTLLPIPFLFASLSVGRPIDATNVIGIPMLYCYFHGVRLLRDRIGLPIAPSIVITTILYCFVGTQLAKVIPHDGAAFYLAITVVLALGIAAIFISSPLAEIGHRTPLPLHIKLPLIALVVLALVSIKSLLHGFLTAAPMVSTIAAYESRHSLKTLCRFVPIQMLFVLPIMVISRLSEPAWGLGRSLIAGWGFAALLMIPYGLHLFRKHGRETGSIASLEEKLENVPEII